MTPGSNPLDDPAGIRGKETDEPLTPVGGTQTDDWKSDEIKRMEDKSEENFHS